MSVVDETDQFFAACGGRCPARLWISASDGIEHEVSLPQVPFLFIGRSVRCQLQLEGSDVSHRHAYIQFVGNRIYCADLASGSGVHWHDAARPWGWIEPNELIAIGKYNLRFELDPEVAETAAARVDGRRPATALRFLNARVQSDRSRLWELGRTVTLLGLDRKCHLPLLHSTVSPVHASVIRTPSGVWVIDLLGKTGVEIDGERVMVARLAVTSVLKIGRFRMVLDAMPQTRLPLPSAVPPSHFIAAGPATGDPTPAGETGSTIQMPDAGRPTQAASVAEWPEPVTDQPEPLADAPEPLADAPEPLADAPEPLADAPEPVTDQPEPLADAPEPTNDDVEPSSGNPEPDAWQDELDGDDRWDAADAQAGSDVWADIDSFLQPLGKSGASSRSAQAPGGQLPLEVVVAWMSRSLAMQQQMLAQQNQMVALAVRLLASLGTRQLLPVRQELTRVQLLTDEIDQIQAKLTGPTGLSADDTMFSPQPDPHHWPPETIDASPLINADAKPPPTAQQGPSGDGRDAAPQGTAGQTEATAAADQPMLNDVELHAMLLDRLNKLQRQRNGYWKRIIHAVRG